MIRFEIGISEEVFNTIEYGKLDKNAKYGFLKALATILSVPLLIIGLGFMALGDLLTRPCLESYYSLLKKEYER